MHVRPIPTRSVCITLLATTALAQQPAGAPQAPAYQVLRRNEDWSFLRDRKEGEPGDPFDWLKYVRLSDDGRVWASLGGQVRERAEGWNDFNFGAPSTADHDDVFLLTRLFAHADVHFGERARILLEAKSALSSERDLVGGNRTSDVDELDLQNAFADFELRAGSAGEVTLRAGRQEFLFGKQRLLSPLEWANARRAFEGVSAVLERPSWRATALVTRPVLVDKFDFNEADDSTDFYGLYAERKPPAGAAMVELYWLALQRDAATYNGTSGEEERHTVGARINGSIRGTAFDYDVEAAWQFGDVGSADIEAAMLGSQVGYKVGKGERAPRIYAGLDYGSGDGTAGDGTVETFNQLFPLGHEFLGYIDALGRQNVIGASLGCGAKLAEKWTGDVRGHVFRLADEDDALYNVGGGVGFAPGGSSSDIGQEIDFTVMWKRSRHSLLQAGYGRFFAGDHLDEVGPGNDVDFVYVTLQFTF